MELEMEKNKLMKEHDKLQK